ncbi:MAG: orotate phosphoribosyltransferase [Bacteroidota bacterium]|nr:orotate phosphoribosyltransferase [Bacteroidota bacterium]
MQSEEILSIFKSTEALLEGHFRLTSGLHSPQYFQCAKVLQYPKHCEILCASIAQFYRDMKIDVIASPALGGIVVGQAVGRQLNARTIFTERQDGVMQLRRGFEIKPGENVLVCEDVVTTGGSTQEVINIVHNAGGNIVGTASVVDRSGGKVKFNVPNQFSVLKIDVITYTPEDCPLCKQNVPIMKPGSRKNK